ncbi:MULTISPECIES: hypothetical protein [unclassified Micromonospora]|uniref:hypothetical protein n=1 Tax=unclassified Micromonospora TaxID=2617518 RepID=UPI001C238809|nr:MULTISPECIES: hypothetical protein [unclassified Micromonospora]MBU8861763.1 hypothetical protein [Micromonospora sp. WMMB482]MDM4781341.1 hypothetical protein [Micromonospora sp. b486]
MAGGARRRQKLLTSFTNASSILAGPVASKALSDDALAIRSRGGEVRLPVEGDPEHLHRTPRIQGDLGEQAVQVIVLSVLVVAVGQHDDRVDPLWVVPVEQLSVCGPDRRVERGAALDV